MRADPSLLLANCILLPEGNSFHPGAAPQIPSEDLHWGGKGPEIPLWPYSYLPPQCHLNGDNSQNPHPGENSFERHGTMRVRPEETVLLCVSLRCCPKCHTFVLVRCFSLVKVFTSPVLWKICEHMAGKLLLPRSSW